MVMVVFSSCRISGIPSVIDNLLIGIVVLYWYASVIFVMRESQCAALEAVSVAPWTVLLWSIHWLYVYSCMVWMSVLVH